MVDAVEDWRGIHIAGQAVNRFGYARGSHFVRRKNRDGLYAFREISPELV